MLSGFTVLVKTLFISPTAPVVLIRRVLTFRAADLAAVLATCHRPRRRERGVESDQGAAVYRRTDAVIAGLLFVGGMRRPGVAALRWADVADVGEPPSGDQEIGVNGGPRVGLILSVHSPFSQPVEAAESAAGTATGSSRLRRRSYD